MPNLQIVTLLFDTQKQQVKGDSYGDQGKTVNRSYFYANQKLFHILKEEQLCMYLQKKQSQ